ncbi:MAG: hypothetical protein AAF307_04075 [Pseudomonadota bacterium]
MIDWVRNAMVLVSLLLGPSLAKAEQNRVADAWTVTFDACLTYVETGQRDTFEGWDVAYPGGGVCNGDPACETSSMTFIPVVRGAVGASLVQVSEPVVGDAPASLTCTPPCCAFYFRKDVEAAADQQLKAWVEVGRLVQDGASDDGATTYGACAYDGRRFDVSVTRGTFSMHYDVSLFADAPLCAQGVS